MDILVSRTLYMSCQAGPGIEPRPSALKPSALPIELTWQTFSISKKHLIQLITKSYEKNYTIMIFAEIYLNGMKVI